MSSVKASGSPTAMRRRPAEKTSDPSARRMKEQAARMDLFMLVTVLFEYLDRVDKTMLNMAKEVSQIDACILLYGGGGAP